MYKSAEIESLVAKWADEKSDATSRALSRVLQQIKEDNGGTYMPILKAISAERLKPPDKTIPAITTEEIRVRVMKLLSEKEKDEKDFGYEPLPEPLGILTGAVIEEFLALRYLGPLRDDPRPVYDIASSADPSHVGYKGEYTAAVLDLFSNEVVDFVSPSDETFSVSRRELKDAVQAWLTHFAIADSFSTKEEGKLGHRLTIQSKGTSRQLDLTNVGVGVSQLMPIVVMARISDPGSILLFEQPELHLHPRVQQLLADFFLAVTKTGRQCIVETHSEYLINRLRRRIAESDWASDLKEKVGVYFVNHTERGSTFQSIKINDYGAMPDWPIGFFDQGPSESDMILRAAQKKRKTKPRPKPDVDGSKRE